MSKRSKRTKRQQSTHKSEPDIALSMKKGRLVDIKRLSAEIHGLDDKLKTMQTAKELKPSSRRNTINDLRNKINEEIAASNAELEKLKNGYAYSRDSVSISSGRSSAKNQQDTAEIVSSLIELEAKKMNKQHQKIEINAELATLREITKELKDKLIIATRSNAEQSVQIKTLKENTQRFVRIGNEQKQRFESDLALKDGIIKDLRSEIIDLKSHLDGRQDKLNEMENMLKNMNDCNKEFEEMQRVNVSEIDTLNRRLLKTQKENERIVKELSNKESVITDLQRQSFDFKQHKIDENEQTIKKLHSNDIVIKDLTSKLDRKDADLERLKNRIDELKKDAQNEKDEYVKRLKQELNELQQDKMNNVKELKNGQNIMNDLRITLNEKEGDLEKMRQQMVELKKKHDKELKVSHHSFIAVDTKQKAEFQRESQAKDLMIDNLQNEIVHSKQRYDAMRDKLRESEQIKGKNDADIAMLEVRNEELTKEMEGKDICLDELNQKILELNNDNKIFRETLSVNENVISDLKNMMNEKNKSMDAMKDYHLSQIDALSTKCNKAQNENDEMLQELNENECTIQELRESNSEKDKILRESQAENERLSVFLSQNEANLVGTEKRLSTMEISFTSKEQELEERISELRLLNDGQIEVIHTLNQKIKDFDALRNELMSENDDLMKQIVELKQKNNEFEERLSKEMNERKSRDTIIHKLQIEVTEHEAKLAEIHKKQIAKYEEEISELKILSKDQFDLIDDLNEKLEKEQNFSKQSQDENKELLQQLNDSEMERRNTEIQIDNVRSSLTLQYVQDLDELKTKSQEQIRLIDEQNRETAKNLENLRKSNDILYKENEEYKEKIGQLDVMRNENDSLEEQVQKLQDHLAEKMDEINEKDKELRRSQSAENELYEMRSSLSLHQEKYEQDVADLRALNQSQIDIINELKERLREVENEIIKVQSKNNVLFGENKEYKDKLRKVINDFAQKNDSLKLRVNDLSSEKDEELKNLRIENKRLSESIADETENELLDIRHLLSENTKKYENELKELRAKNKETIASLKKHNQSSQVLRQRIKFLVDNEKKWEKVTNERKERMNKLKTENEKLTKTVKTMQAGKKARDARNEALKREIDILHASYSGNADDMSLKQMEQMMAMKREVDASDAALEKTINEIKDEQGEKEKRLQRKLDKMKEENEQIRKRLMGDEGKECLFKKEIVDLQRLSDNQSDIIDEIKSKKSGKEKRLIKANNALQRRVNKLKEENEKFMRQIMGEKGKEGKLKRAIGELKRRNASQAEMIDDLNEVVQSLRDTSSKELIQALIENKEESEMKMELLELKQSISECQGSKAKENVMMKGAEIIDDLNEQVQSLSDTSSKQSISECQGGYAKKNDTTQLTKKERIRSMRIKRMRLNEIINKLNVAQNDITAELLKMKQNKGKCGKKKKKYGEDREYIAGWHIFGHKHCLE